MSEAPDHSRPVGRGPNGVVRGGASLLLLDARARLVAAAASAAAIWLAVVWAVG